MNCGLELHFPNTNEVCCFFITLEFLEIFENLICDVYSGECLDLFKAYVIGKQILESDRTVFLTFATVWDMLNIWRALQAGYLVQLLCDVTSKASTAALNKLAFGVNMLGGHFAPWTCTLIPAESESEAAYSAAYAASKNATRAVMRLPLCEDDDCLTCHAAEPTQAWPSINQGIRGG